MNKNQFRDKKGDEWTIELSIGLVERIRRSTAYNLYAPDEPPHLDGPPPAANAPQLQQLLWTDYGTLYEVLWAVCEDEAEARKINALEFGKRLGAEALIAAQSAFFAEWRDFFRQLRRPDLLMMLEKLEKLQQTVQKMAEEKLRDPRQAELEREAERMLQAALDDAVTRAMDDGFGKLRAL